MAHRILQIIPTLDRGGAEKQLVLLSAGLPRERFEVHVCVLTRTGPLAAELDRAGIPWTLIGKRWKLDPWAYRRLRRFVAVLRPDLVQTWLFAANSYGRAAALACGVPHILASERSVDPWKRWHELAIDRYLARRTDAIVVNSPGVCAFYARHGIPRDKFVVIPNAVEPSPPSSYTRETLLDELKLPRAARLLGAIGRLWPQKRVKDLIWATDLLKVIRDDAHLLIIGDGPLRSRLERYRHLVRIEDRVHFLGRRDDVPDILPHLDLLCLASGYEGLPNVIMEALAAGVPVVATDIPGNRELIRSGENGFLVPVGDRAGFAKYAEKILNNSALRTQLGLAGQKLMREQYSGSKMIERYSALYDRVLGGGEHGKHTAV